VGTKISILETLKTGHFYSKGSVYQNRNVSGYVKGQMAYMADRNSDGMGGMPTDD
jgi:hypothetical protein